MAQPFLALITPVGSTGPVDPGWSGGVAPPGGGQPGYPSHPIYNPPYPDHGLPPFPSHPIAPGGGGGYPSHPIYNPAYPDQGLPPFPSHPIAPGGGGTPPGIWGPTDPRPTPPIYIPAQPILPDSGDPTKAHIVVYVPGAGAVSFTVDLTQLPEPVPPTEPEPK